MKPGQGGRATRGAMGGYILKRLVSAIPVLFGIT
jgi:hypothetical protein